MANWVPAVGVFDSGVGGLTIFEAVRERMPQARYYYLSDNGNFPYGVKSESQVVQCTLDGTSRFVSRFQLDLLIIACNTASTIALDTIRARLKIPVIGVVPAIKPAVAMSRSRTIGLLATPGTISRPYTHELIEEFAKAARMISCGSGLLVKLAEGKLRGEKVAVETVAHEIAPLFEASPKEEIKRLDTIVLGCTHFPLLKEELKAAAPWPVQWVDSSQAIAARAFYLMTQKDIEQEMGHATVHNGEQNPHVTLEEEVRSDPPHAEGSPVLQGRVESFCVTRWDQDAERLKPVSAAYGFKKLELL